MAGNGLDLERNDFDPVTPKRHPVPKKKNSRNRENGYLENAIDVTEAHGDHLGKKGGKDNHPRTHCSIYKLGLLSLIERWLFNVCGWGPLDLGDGDFRVLVRNGRHGHPFLFKRRHSV